MVYKIDSIKVIILIFGVLATGNVSADITFFNKSKIYDMELTYKFCHAEADKWICTDIKILQLKHKANESDKTYITVPTTDNEQKVIILNAVEKNDRRDIVAQAKYDLGSDEWSLCSSNLYTYDNQMQMINYNVGFALDDMGESPFIMCQVGGY